MNDENSTKPESTFYWISGVAMVWNAFGILAYIGQATMGPETLANLPDAQRALYEGMPAWATTAYAIAVHAGALGCLLLLFRKALAIPVLIASLAGVFVQFFHAYFMTNYIEVFGRSSIVTSMTIIAIGVYLVWFAINAKRKGWIS